MKEDMAAAAAAAENARKMLVIQEEIRASKTDAKTDTILEMLSKM